MEKNPVAGRRGTFEVAGKVVQWMLCKRMSGNPKAEE